MARNWLKNSLYTLRDWSFVIFCSSFHVVMWLSYWFQIPAQGQQVLEGVRRGGLVSLTTKGWQAKPTSMELELGAERRTICHKAFYIGCQQSNRLDRPHRPTFCNSQIVDSVSPYRQHHLASTFYADMSLTGSNQFEEKASYPSVGFGQAFLCWMSSLMPTTSVQVSSTFSFHGTSTSEVTLQLARLGSASTECSHSRKGHGFMRLDESLKWEEGTDTEQVPVWQLEL